MYLDVIPLDHSFWNRSLTYSVGDVFDPHTLSPWWLVLVPFGKKETPGIVVRTHDILSEEPENIKNIVDIITSLQLFDGYQLTMMERLAKKYLLPIHKVARIFFPRPLEKRLEKKNYPIGALGKTDPHIPKNGIFLSQNNTLHPMQIWDKFEENSVLIVPDDRSLMQFLPHKRETDLFLPNESTDTKKSDAWIEIVNRKPQRIVWTRRLLSYNLRGYSKILYFEDAFSHEYYHYPIRIGYTDMLAYLHESEQFSLEIWTSIPRLKTLATFHHFPVTYINH